MEAEDVEQHKPKHERWHGVKDERDAGCGVVEDGVPPPRLVDPEGDRNDCREDERGQREPEGARNEDPEEGEDGLVLPVGEPEVEVHDQTPEILPETVEVGMVEPVEQRVLTEARLCDSGPARVVRRGEGAMRLLHVREREREHDDEEHDEDPGSQAADHVRAHSEMITNSAARPCSATNVG